MGKGGMAGFSLNATLEMIHFTRRVRGHTSSYLGWSSFKTLIADRS